MVINLTRENVAQTIQGNKVTVIDFWATWCGPCKMFGPIFDKVAESFDGQPDVAFCKAEISGQPDIANHFQVRSVPTIIVIKGGQVVHSQAGGPDAQTLTAIVQRALTA